jgi:uncharacterized protein (DUF58 family)
MNLMNPKITRAGWLLILLTFLLYLASMTSRSGLLFLILGIIFGVFVISFVGAIMSCRRIQIIPAISQNCTEGETLQESWTIVNSSSAQAGFVELWGEFGTILRVGCLPKGQTVHLTPELKMARRGAYSHKQLALTSTFPFGLVSYSEGRELDGEIVVYPAPYPCPEPPASGFEPMLGGKYHGMTRASTGDSFHGVRPYQNSDPVKLIHWKCSAKGLGLMSKEFDEELSGRVGIVFDPAAPSVDRLDKAARAAASLVMSALDAGHQVEFVVIGTSDLVQVPPFADGSTVLECLARLNPTTPRDLDALEQAVLTIPPKASLCFVSYGLTPDVEGVLSQGGKRRVVRAYLPDDGSSSNASSIPIVRYGSGHMSEGGPSHAG